MPAFFSWLKRHMVFRPIVQLPVGEWIPRSRSAKVIFTIISVTMFGALLWDFVSRLVAKESTIVVAPSIQVFIPNPDRSEEGAFYQDGVVQKRGFDKAVKDADDIPNKLRVEFQFMKREDTADVIIALMKESYEKRGATFFVMTMSTKIAALRQHFEIWHKECIRQRKREPVLIATVASAPDLPNASGGIVRWYIRSDEESALLAEYMRWRLGVTHAAVFYITRSQGLADDAYGKRGMEVFRDRFEALGGGDPKAFSVTAGSAAVEVARFISQGDWRQFEATREVGVFVVGYGDMVKNTLSELVASGFDGPIVCASTLSEPDWQPKETKADDRIFSVLPRFINPRTKFHGHERNMVFFFAKKTLFRVLEMTASNSNSATFIERWKDGEHDPQLDQEYLANGDTIVQLDVVGMDYLR